MCLLKVTAGVPAPGAGAWAAGPAVVAESETRTEAWATRSEAEERQAAGVDALDAAARAGRRLEVPVEVVDRQDLHLDGLAVAATAATSAPTSRPSGSGCPRSSW